MNQAQPGIFRDMSAVQEVSALLQKLAGGTISAEKAQEEAKRLTSPNGSGAGSAGGGSTKSSPSEQHDQLQVLRNVEQHGDITPEQKQAYAQEYLQSNVHPRSWGGGRPIVSDWIQTALRLRKCPVYHQLQSRLDITIVICILGQSHLSVANLYHILTASLYLNARLYQKQGCKLFPLGKWEINPSAFPPQQHSQLANRTLIVPSTKRAN